MTDVLIIVPCGKSKVWDYDPAYGPAKARDAYTGTLFRLNRRYAEKFGDRWLVLSAKYGFIEPGFAIPAPYDVSFKRKQSDPIDIESLRAQVARLDLHAISTLVGLGGAEYREKVRLVFGNQVASLEFPFEGLKLGYMLQATKQAIDSGISGIRDVGKAGAQ
ncbi:MAG: hypothetical protein M3457_16655 [Chloroflexota bacterium]|nr:hypothetical protein [Chloroflexota bacterium]